MRAALRALALAVLSFTALVTLPGAAPLASAHDGDLLYDAGGARVLPGDPCHASGAYGGIAVDEARGRLYYGLRDAPKVYVTTTKAPFTCLQTLTIANVPSNVGFRRLAFDASTTAASGLLWGALDDHSARVLRIDVAASAATGSYQHPALSGDISGVAVEKVAPFRNVAILAGTATARYFDDNGVDLGAVTLRGIPTGAEVRGATTWGGALLAGDDTFTLYFHDATGAFTGRALAPHRDYADEFYQPQVDTSPYWWDDVAIDASSYASLGRVALFTIQGWQDSVCVKNCQATACVKYCQTRVCDQLDNEGFCIYHDYCDGVLGACTQPPQFGTTCDGAPGPCTAPEVDAPRYHTTIQAHAIKDCLDPLGSCGVPPPCTPPPPPLALARDAPTNGVYVNDAPTGGQHAPALAYGDKITVRFHDAGGPPGARRLVLSGPLPGLPMLLPASVNGWSAQLPLASAGTFTLTAVETDPTNACVAPVAIAFPLQVARPYLFSHAQSVRVSGNLPADLMLGTPAMDAVQALVGREALQVAGWDGALVVPTTAGIGATEPAHVGVLSALAEHAPNATTRASAHARTQMANVSLGPGAVDVCPAPPTVCASGPAPDQGRAPLTSDATAAVDVDSGVGTALAFVDITGGFPHAACAPDCARDLVVGGVRVHVSLAESWQRAGRGYAEGYASVARFTFLDEPFRGEIVLGESYAAASTVGLAPLAGLPRLMAQPDDYGTGADAPPLGGPLLDNGTYAGSFAGADRADSFTLRGKVGDDVRVVLSPAPRVEAAASTVPTLPTGQATLRQMSVRLVDPLGNVRDASFVASPQSLNARPAQVELALDITGTWTVVVERRDAGVDQADYGIALAILQPPYATFDATPGTTTGSACASALPMPAPALTGWLGAGEVADAWSFQATAGRPIVVTMTPLASESADFDLALLLPGCAAGPTSATHGDGLLPKGAPETVTLTPTASGTFTVLVTRYSGVGDYALSVAAS